MPDLKQTLNSHNAAIDSPELDRSAEAPENDPAASAPEHFIVSSTNLPIPVTAIEDDYKEKYLKLVDQIEKEPLERDDGARNWRFRRKVWILICGVILIVGIAIGVGTGLGISSRNQGSPSTPTVSTTPTPSPNPNLIDDFLPHGILSDSSIAAAVTSEGNKHFMFQDSAGLLRDAFYSTTTQTWTSTDHFVIPGNARNNSPLAAIIYENGPDFTPDQVVLFYVDQNNQVNYTMWSNGNWYVGMIGLFDFTNITLIDSPRTLSVTKVTNPFSSRIPRSEGYVLSIMVLIDAPDQKFTALFGNSSLIRNGTIWERQYWGGPWTWTDASTKLETYLGAPLIAPFAAVSSLNPQLSNSSYMSLMAFAGDKSVSTIKLGIFTADYVATHEGVDVNGPAEGHMVNLHDVTDVVIAQIYPGTREPAIDMVTARTGTNISWYSIDEKPPTINPTTPFPYPKLATTVKTKGTAFSLFHQINATTFAEDMWDSDARIWKSAYVDVHTW